MLIYLHLYVNLYLHISVYLSNIGKCIVMGLWVIFHICALLYFLSVLNCWVVAVVIRNNCVDRKEAWRNSSMQKKTLNIYPVLFKHLMKYQAFLFLFFVYFGLVFVFFFGCTACRISVPRPGFEPRVQQWKPRILTTRSPGNFLLLFLKQLWCWN